MQFLAGSRPAGQPAGRLVTKNCNLWCPSVQPAVWPGEDASPDSVDPRKWALNDEIPVQMQLAGKNRWSWLSLQGSDEDLRSGPVQSPSARLEGAKF